MNNQRYIPWLVALAMVVTASTAAAQSEGTTRAGAARAARDAKAAAQVRTGPGRIERVLNALETDGIVRRWLEPRDGFGLRLGGIEDGPGTAVGPMWRNPHLLGGRMQLSASTAASIRGDTDMNAAIALPRVGSSRVALRLEGAMSTLTQRRFFGTGVNSVRARKTFFGLSRRTVRTTATVKAANWLELSAGAGLLRTSARDGHSSRVPGVSTLFTAAEAPGLGLASEFTVFSVAASVDWRDVKGNPRRGGLISVGLDRYVDRGATLHSFTRVNLEVEQHVAAWKGQRVLTLRGIASMAAPDRGHEVPIYLQRTLGGSRSLRGFVPDRFRDRQIALLQAEYGWDLLPFVSAVLFAEGGAVSREWRDMSFNRIRRDYGIGFRFGSARTVALRTDVAFGSGEGTRFAMRFGHAF